MPTMEKPRSKKSETYFRHNGTADHGTIGNKREKFPAPIDKDGNFFDTDYLRAKGVPVEENNDFDNMSPEELEDAADKMIGVKRGLGRVATFEAVPQPTALDRAQLDAKLELYAAKIENDDFANDDEREAFKNAALELLESIKRADKLYAQSRRTNR